MAKPNKQEELEEWESILREEIAEYQAARKDKERWEEYEQEHPEIARY